MEKQNYEPQELQFVLPEAVVEMFPLELEFHGCETEKDVLKKVNEHFNCMFPENETTMRYMDEFEKDTIRKEYCELVEKDLPEAEADLISAVNQAKALKSNAESKLQSIRKQIADLAAEVNDGTVTKKLPSTKTWRIALNGYFLYYAMINDKVRLVKAEKIASYDKSSLWAQEDKNRTAMMELFGLEFPEVEVPTDEEHDKEHDLDPEDEEGVYGEEDLNEELGDE